MSFLILSGKLVRELSNPSVIGHQQNSIHLTYFLENSREESKLWKEIDIKIYTLIKKTRQPW
jgi:hypothetical protein